jgi:hypothetical protein
MIPWSVGTSISAAPGLSFEVNLVKSLIARGLPESIPTLRDASSRSASARARTKDFANHIHRRRPPSPILPHDQSEMLVKLKASFVEAFEVFHFDPVDFHGWWLGGNFETL